MSRRILVIVGHPDPDPARFCRALAEAYAHGAQSAGHVVRNVDPGTIDFPLLRTMEEFQHGVPPASLKDAAEAIGWAEHIVFVFPLWLGTMPALLKGRSARVVVTLGMPAFFYRLWFLSHGIAGMRRNILNFVGIKPVRETLFGLVEGVSAARRERWIEKMRSLGERGA